MKNNAFEKFKKKYYPKQYEKDNKNYFKFDLSPLTNYLKNKKDKTKSYDQAIICPKCDSRNIKFQTEVKFIQTFIFENGTAQPKGGFVEYEYGINLCKILCQDCKYRWDQEIEFRDAE